MSDDETRQEDRSPVVPGPPTTAEHDALLDVLEEQPPASEAHGDTDLTRAAARRIRAVRLRVNGATFEQIAQICGYADRSTARGAVMRALERAEAESVSELRQIENMRLDADEQVLRAIITSSNTKPETKIRAIDSRLRLSARRGRLNGSDAPLQVALSAGVASDLADALREAEEVLTSAFVPGEVLDSVDEPVEREEA